MRNFLFIVCFIVVGCGDITRPFKDSCPTENEVAFRVIENKDYSGCDFSGFSWRGVVLDQETLNSIDERFRDSINAQRNNYYNYRSLLDSINLLSDSNILIDSRSNVENCRVSLSVMNNLTPKPRCIKFYNNYCCNRDSCLFLKKKGG